MEATNILNGKPQNAATGNGRSETTFPMSGDMFVGWEPTPNEQSNGKKGPKGVPRLAHKKSKTGCQRCRARRVKCDETKPICSGCNRHQVSCVYDHFVRGENAENPSTGTLTSKTKPTEFTATLETTDRRLLELKLMHQWTLSTSLTFPLAADPSLRDINTTIMPTLGLTNEALLYTLFFLSALHLLKTEKYSVEAAHAYQRYLDMALRAHRDDVTNLTRDKADVACMTSGLLRLGSFAILSDRGLVAPYTPPTQWMNMNQGATAVHMATWPWIVENPLSIANRAVIQKAPNLSDFKTLYHPSNRQGLLHLLTTPSGYAETEAWSLKIQEAYEQTLSYIGAMQVALDAGIEGHTEILRRCVGFPGLIPKLFLDLVQELNPRALVILAHYFAYLARFKDIWWVGDAGAREVRVIGSSVGVEWIEMMRWPLRTVEELYS